MVQELDLQKASAFGNASCQPEIDVTRRRIAGWVVVNQDEGVGRMADRRLEDFSGVSKAFVQCSFRNLADGDQAEPGVQQNHTKGLAVESAHLGAEQLIDGLRMIERF